MLNGHGDDAYRYDKEIRADFSSNVWYGGEPKGLKEYVLQHWNAINKYPEVTGESLAEKISRHHSLHPSNILIANGTTESIYLIAQAFKRHKTSIVTPAFSEYEDACRMHEHEITFVNWETLTTEKKANANLLFLCNPNNPTGQTVEEVEALVKGHQQTVFVIDEAFIEFTFSINSLIHLANKYVNLIILRSLTKAYAIPGLRLGYIVAHQQMIEKLKTLKSPWSVNVLALLAGHFIFDHYNKIQIPLQQLLKDKDDFISELHASSIKTYNSHTHFFLAETKRATATSLKKHLINNYGILIRDASNFRGLGKNHFRLATLSPAKNKLLTEALKEWEHPCS